VPAQAPNRPAASCGSGRNQRLIQKARMTTVGARGGPTSRPSAAAAARPQPLQLMRRHCRRRRGRRGRRAAGAPVAAAAARRRRRAGRGRRGRRRRRARPRALAAAAAAAAAAVCEQLDERPHRVVYHDPLWRRAAERARQLQAALQLAAEVVRQAGAAKVVAAGLERDALVESPQAYLAAQVLERRLLRRRVAAGRGAQDWRRRGGRVRRAGCGPAAAAEAAVAGGAGAGAGERGRGAAFGRGRRLRRGARGASEGAWQAGSRGRACKLAPPPAPPRCRARLGERGGAGE
jgi:hypothetical protein